MSEGQLFKSSLLALCIANALFGMSSTAVAAEQQEATAENIERSEEHTSELQSR